LLLLLHIFFSLLQWQFNECFGFFQCHLTVNKRYALVPTIIPGRTIIFSFFFIIIVSQSKQLFRAWLKIIMNNFALAQNSCVPLVSNDSQLCHIKYSHPNCEFLNAKETILLSQKKMLKNKPTNHSKFSFSRYFLIEVKRKKILVAILFAAFY